MSLVSLFVRKDVARLRLLLAGSVALVVVRVLAQAPSVANLMSTPDRPSFGAALPLLLSLSEAATAAIAIALLVHSDLPGGSTAFWRTRPIRGRSLLASKLAFVGVFLVLPAVLGELVALRWNGAGARELALASPEVVVDRVAFVTVVLAVAALTRSTAHLVWVGVVAIIAHGVLAFVFARLAPLEVWLTFDHNPYVRASVTLAERLVGIAFALAVAVHQYTTRRTDRSWAIACVGIVATLAVANFLPLNFLGVLSPTEATISEATMRVRVAGDMRWVSNDGSPRLVGEARKIIAAPLVVEGVAPPYVAVVEILEGSLTFGDGTRLTFDMRRHGVVERLVDPPWDPDAVAELLEGPTFANPSRVPEQRTALLSVPPREYERLSSVPGTYRARARVVLYEYAAGAAVPLAAGARVDHGLDHAVVVDVASQSQIALVRVRETLLDLLLAPRDTVGLSSSAWLGRNGQPALYLLHNAGRREALWPQTSAWPHLPVLKHRIAQRPVVLEYRPVGGDRPLADGWFADATLRRIRKRAYGEVAADLRAEGFRMAPENERDRVGVRPDISAVPSPSPIVRYPKPPLDVVLTRDNVRRVGLVVEVDSGQDGVEYVIEVQLVPGEARALADLTAANPDRSIQVAVDGATIHLRSSARRLGDKVRFGQWKDRNEADDVAQGIARELAKRIEAD